MKKILENLLVAGCILAVTGCGGQNEKTDASTDSDNQCEPTVPKGDGAIGDSCKEMEDCQSGFCLTFSHAKADPDATCEEAPALGDFRLTGTVTDFLTSQPVPGATVKIGGALDILQTPEAFPVAETIVADSDGRVDQVLTGATTEIALGLVAVVAGDGNYPTSTGLVKPEMGCGLYPPGNRNPDIKVIKEADLARLSDELLTAYPALDSLLPLGERGGVLGIIKDVDTGDGLSGATIVSRNDNSVAEIYYYDEAGATFNQDASDSTGIFVILGAGVAEEFDGVENGKVISRREATMGETQKVIFTTTVQVQR